MLLAFFLKTETSKQLEDLFNLPFVTSLSKLGHSIFCPISPLSNMAKIFENLMYKRLYTFVNNSKTIYNLQFGFRQQYSTYHALINITENIRKTLDDENIGHGVFVDLLKTFDIVDHQIQLAKFSHYGDRGV